MSSSVTIFNGRVRLSALALLLAAAACSGGADEKSGGGGGGQGARQGGGAGGGSGGKNGGKGGQNQGPPQVGYIVAQTASSPETEVLAGRIAAYESSDVRPQVNGVIQKRLFKEGQLVHQGQPLYQIDPSLYRAATNQAAANLQSAQANADATRIQAERYEPLVKIQAVSKQDYTNAVAAARQGAATVAQNKAALDTARINLRFTTVPAPITGRIGRSLATVGALVSSSQTDPLAQIQRLDPIFVDIQQSAADLLTLRRELAREGITPASAQVRLTLDDGSDYPYTGTLEFAEVVVAPDTGTVTVRARFPNREGILLPGMFVRAKFASAIDRRVFLTPQQAVTRDVQGRASVFVVGKGNKAEQRQVRAERTQGVYWVVTQGLNPGDRVITQGLALLKPGEQVSPVPANTPEKLQPPAKDKDGKGGGGGKAGGSGGKQG